MHFATQQLVRMIEAIALALSVALVLLVASGHELIEESPSENVTCEVEFLIVRDDAKPPGQATEKAIPFRNDKSVRCLRTVQRDQSAASSTERGKMNGLGTYLLI